MATVRSSLRVPGFAPLAGSYALNELGDNFGVIALALLVVNHTHSAIATAALFFVSKAIPAMISPFFVAALDRRQLGRVLPMLYAIQALLFGGLALCVDTFLLSLVLALALADGTVALTARGLGRGAVAGVLGPAGLLREGNALLNVAFAVTSAAGPALAGLVAGQAGLAAALWLDAASFLAVALVLLGSRRVLPVAQVGPRERVLERVRAGIEHVREHEVAGRLMAGQALAIVFFTLVLPVEVVYAKESLGASDLGFGLLLTSWGIGIVVGSAVFARSRQRSLRTLVIGSTALVGLGYAGMAVAPTLLVACLASALGGLGNGVQWVAVMTTLQEAVEDEFQARAAGLLESVAAFMPGLGFVLGGAAAAIVSPRAAFAVAAVGVGAVVVLWARRSPVPGAVAA